MASNDDEVLTDEQIQTLIASNRQKQALRQQAEERRYQVFLLDYVETRLPDFLYFYDVKGEERDKYMRWLLGDNSVYEYPPDFHWDVRKDARECYAQWKSDVTEARQRKVWAFSLTTPDKSAAPDLWDASIRLFEQQSVPISQGECFLEYGSSDLPHVHGWYETEHGGRVFTKVFKRVWPLWGEDRRHHTKFRGGYHELVKNPESYELYASAEQRLIVRKIKSQPLVYGKSRPSSSSSAAPQKEASASPDAQSC